MICNICWYVLILLMSWCSALKNYLIVVCEKVRMFRERNVQGVNKATNQLKRDSKSND